jgi:hypothetical protein
VVDSRTYWTLDIGLLSKNNKVAERCSVSPICMFSIYPRLDVYLLQFSLC